MNLKITVTNLLGILIINVSIILSLHIGDPPEGLHIYVYNVIKNSIPPNNPEKLINFAVLSEWKMNQLCLAYLTTKNIPIKKSIEKIHGYSGIPYVYLVSVLIYLDIPNDLGIIERKIAAQQHVVSCPQVLYDKRYPRFFMMMSPLERSVIFFEILPGSKVYASEETNELIFSVTPSDVVLEIIENDFNLIPEPSSNPL